jgi:hypothetical protein
VFDVDRAANHGDPWIFLHCCHHAIPNIVPWGLYLLAWLVRGRLWDELPRPVDTMLTFSTRVSGCSEIFLLSTAGKAAAICASWVSIILLKLNWFLSVEDKFQALHLNFPGFCHWPKAFFYIFVNFSLAKNKIS